MRMGVIEKEQLGELERMAQNKEFSNLELAFLDVLKDLSFSKNGYPPFFWVEYFIFFLLLKFESKSFVEAAYRNGW